MKTYIGKPAEINKQFAKECNAGVFKLNKEYVCEVKEIKGGKTDAQRSRYWAMAREYARLLKVGQSEIHNIQLAELGIIARDNDGTPMTQLHKPDYNWQKDYYRHLKPTGTIIKTQNGEELRIFYVLKNSEDFTTEEYSQLIETIINNIIQDGLDNEIDINYMGV